MTTERTNMKTCNISMLLVKVTLIILFVNMLSHGTNAQSRLKSNILNLRAKRDFNFCGSRLIDKLNQMCGSNIWEAQMCLFATRYFCRRGRFRKKHPICYFRCVTTRKRRSTSQSYVDEATYINELKALFSRAPEHRLSDLLGNSERNRMKRNIYSECCHDRCDVTVVKEYCSAP